MFKKLVSAISILFIIWLVFAWNQYLWQKSEYIDTYTTFTGNELPNAEWVSNSIIGNTSLSSVLWVWHETDWHNIFVSDWDAIRLWVDNNPAWQTIYWEAWWDLTIDAWQWIFNFISEDFEWNWDTFIDHTTAKNWVVYWQDYCTWLIWNSLINKSCVEWMITGSALKSWSAITINTDNTINLNWPLTDDVWIDWQWHMYEMWWFDEYNIMWANLMNFNADYMYFSAQGNALIENTHWMDLQVEANKILKLNSNQLNTTFDIEAHDVWQFSWSMNDVFITSDWWDLIYDKFWDIIFRSENWTNIDLYDDAYEFNTQSNNWFSATDDWNFYNNLIPTPALNADKRMPHKYYVDHAIASWIQQASLKSWNLVTINWSNEIDLWWTANNDAILDMDWNEFMIQNNQSMADFAEDEITLDADWWSIAVWWSVSLHSSNWWDVVWLNVWTDLVIVASKDWRSWVLYQWRRPADNDWNFWADSLVPLEYITWLIDDSVLTGWELINVSNWKINLWWETTYNVDLTMNNNSFWIDDASSVTFFTHDWTILDIYDQAFDFYTAGWSWFEWRYNWVYYRHDYASNNPLRVPHKKYVDDAIASVSSNIYNSDWTLTGNRIVDWNWTLYNLTFKDLYNFIITWWLNNIIWWAYTKINDWMNTHTYIKVSWWDIEEYANNDIKIVSDDFINIKWWEWEQIFDWTWISFWFPTSNIWTVWYVNDLSWYYTDRSFTDKWYVDNKIASVSSNIYNSDWTLTGNRIVDWWWNSLTFNNNSTLNLFANWVTKIWNQDYLSINNNTHDLYVLLNAWNDALVAMTENWLSYSTNWINYKLWNHDYDLWWQIKWDHIAWTVDIKADTWVSIDTPTMALTWWVFRITDNWSSWQFKINSSWDLDVQYLSWSTRETASTFTK